jgi:hypothetical protein
MKKYRVTFVPKRLAEEGDALPTCSVNVITAANEAQAEQMAWASFYETVGPDAEVWKVGFIVREEA